MKKHLLAGIDRRAFVGGVTFLAVLFLGAGTGHALLEVVAKTGDPAPDGNGIFGTVGQSVLNEAGEVGFFAAMEPDSAPGFGGTFVWSSAGGMTQVVRHGDVEPDGVTQMGGGSSPGLNDSGQASFHEVFSFDPDDQGIYFGSGGPITRVARTGQAAPDGNGAYLFLDGVPSINNTGQMSFWASLSGTTGGEADDEGLFIGSGGPATQVARKGQSAPDGNGTIHGFIIQPALNDAGQVAFLTELDGTTGGTDDDEGIYVGSGGALTRIVRKGQAAPGGGGTFTGFELHSSINNSGAVAFVGLLPETPDEEHPGHFIENSGVYTGSGGELTQLARTGDAAPDGNGSFFNFGVPTMNNHGDVVFRGWMDGFSGGFEEQAGIFAVVDGTLTQMARGGQATPDGSSFFWSFASQPSITDSGLVAFTRFDHRHTR